MYDINIVVLVKTLITLGTCKDLCTSNTNLIVSDGMQVSWGEPQFSTITGK